WIARDGQLRGTLHSYFDGEADQSTTLPMPPDGVVEDALPILVRGLRGPWLRPGESRTVPFLRASLRTRLGHKPAAWGQARVERSAQAEPVKTAIGTLNAWRYTVAEIGGDTITFTVEDAPPHRLVAWRSSGGEAGEILGSARLRYWELHKN